MLLTTACGGGGGGGVYGGKSTPTHIVATPNPAFADLAGRAVNLPTATSGDCPVSEAQLLSPTQPFVVGTGPVYASGLGSSSTLHIKTLPAGGDWLGNYIVWSAGPSFEGKILIRGARIDADGLLGFDYAPNVPAEPTSDRLELDTETAESDPDLGGWAWTSYARMKEPGCYAVQVDTEDDSYVIVFQADEQG